MISRRAFSTALLAGAAASLLSTRGMAANATPTKARNVVLVHGLFADGSCWLEVIPRLQAAGLNVTSVQNSLTTLPEAVASAERVLARQDGPTVLVGHSFSGMIVTEAGVHPNVSALVYVAARAPDAGEDYTALAKTYPTPPASAGIVFDGDEGRLSAWRSKPSYIGFRLRGVRASSGQSAYPFYQRHNAHIRDSHVGVRCLRLMSNGSFGA